MGAMAVSFREADDIELATAEHLGGMVTMHYVQSQNILRRTLRRHPDDRPQLNLSGVIPPEPELPRPCTSRLRLA